MRVRLRSAGAVVLAAGLQWVLTLWAGRTVPVLLLPLVCLLGMHHGPQIGTECGMFAGVLGWVGGISPWFLLIYPLLGGLAGKVFPKVGGFWGNWLRLLPLLAVGEGTLLLVHGPEGWPVAWREGLLALACYPLAAGLARISGPGRRGG